MAKRLLLDTMVKEVKADRRPVSLIGGGAWSMKQGGTTFKNVAEQVVKDPATLSAVHISAAKKIGEGIVYVGAGFNNALAAAVRGVELIYKGDSSPYLPDISTEDAEKLIKGIDKIDVKKIWEDPLLHSMPAATEQVMASLKESHVIAPITWGPFTFAGQLIGAELLMRKMVKDPAAASAVLEWAVQLIQEYYRPFVDRKLIDIVYLPEPTASGDMISARIFEKFAAPAIDKSLEPYNSQGIPTLLHICGKLLPGQLEVLNNMKNMSTISVDSKVQLKDAREKITNKSIMGNVDTQLLDRGTEEGIVNSCEQTYADMEGHDRFILSPACDISPGTPLGSVKTMFDFARSNR